jgi:hypothetical protein
VYLASTNRQLVHDVWLINSSAYCHMTPIENCSVNMRDMKEEMYS